MRAFSLRAALALLLISSVLTGCYTMDFDQDDDGVHNRRDTCPDTPAGTSIFPNGCPIKALPQPVLADRFVLLPDEDGKVGEVVVTTAGVDKTLSSAYSCAQVADAGQIKGDCETAEAVNNRYGELLAARPEMASSFLVYFVSGSNQLTPESAAVIEQIKSEIAQRPAPEVRVIGHADRVGSPQSNDALSIRRAATVQAILIENGVAADSIELAGRGELEPAVETADEVSEARNRRVEISIR
jgi:outer membrane protein OmpA-like peptidoglycan-associated protein